MASAVDEAPPTATEPAANAFALDERLAALGGLGLDQLRGEWRRLHRRAAPPARLSRDLLLRSIAHRLQEDALGGLRPAAERRLASLARGVAKGEPAAAPAAVRLKPGTTLVREWHGRTHTVLVLADGFEHQGRRYASLTRLARSITGAHWSGPRFFGLRRGTRPAGAHAQADRAGDA